MGSAGRLAMPALVSTVRVSRPLLLLALGAGLIVAATLALWAYYGTAVFFEIVRTGWTACF
jgi:flagellar biosynthesis protein FliQ